jgi:PPM family protein phosphatase
MSLAARYAARSDIGRHRQTNEDAWLARPPLFAVADGMGGAQAGEVASRVALETLAAHAAAIDPLDREAAGVTLLAACHEANQRVWRLSQEHASRAGMGTTLTALALCSDGARLAHIGDSRAYLLREGVLSQVSDDHSLVGEMVRSGELPAQEAIGHPLRSILSRALGTEADPQIDLLDLDLRPGDVLLLCSDGLTGPVADARIALLLAEPDPEQAARRLVDAALREGGPDNITVVVVRLEGPVEVTAGFAAEASARPRATAAGGLSATAAVAGADTAGASEAPTATAPEAAAPGAPDGPAASGADPFRGSPGSASPAGAALAGAGVAPDAKKTDSADEAASAALEAPAVTTTSEGVAVAAASEAVAVTAAPSEASPAAAPAPERPYLGGAAAPPAAAPAARRGRRRWLIALVSAAIVLALLAAAAGVIGQLEWVGVADDGVVTVNRGLPWEFAGLRLYREHQRTAILYADLSPAQKQIVDQHDIGWQGSGERLLSELGVASP